MRMEAVFFAGEVKTLAPGETHVAWVKFKVAAVSDDK